MTLRFSKMHGIGNDFVVLDARSAPPSLDAATIRALGDRRTGVGFDQLLSVEPARDPGCAYYYGIWNTDGSPSGQCGNGVRCVAAWLHRAGALALGEAVRLESPSGPVTVRLLSPHEVTVDMGEPVFAPARIPFAAAAEADRYAIEVDGATLAIGAASMGNPHAVVMADELPDGATERLGPALSTHPRFAAGANAGFVQRIGRSRLVAVLHARKQRALRRRVEHRPGQRGKAEHADQHQRRQRLGDGRLASERLEPLEEIARAREGNRQVAAGRAGGGDQRVSHIKPACS